MNAEFILKLADTIEAANRFDLGQFAYNEGDEGYGLWDMSVAADDVLHNCKTTACVAGWANAIDKHTNLADVEHAAELMGLDDVEAENLFFGQATAWKAVSPGGGFDANAKQTATLLRGYVAGTFDFSSLYDDEEDDDPTV